jgi:hypothetical protein
VKAASKKKVKVEFCFSSGLDLDCWATGYKNRSFTGCMLATFFPFLFFQIDKYFFHSFLTGSHQHICC